MMYRCGAKGHGLVADLAVLGLQSDSMILKVFCNPDDFMIVWF